LAQGASTQEVAGSTPGGLVFCWGSIFLLFRWTVIVHALGFLFFARSLCMALVRALGVFFLLVRCMALVRARWGSFFCSFARWGSCFVRARAGAMFFALFCSCARRHFLSASFFPRSRPLGCLRYLTDHHRDLSLPSSTNNTFQCTHMDLNIPLEEQENSNGRFDLNIPILEDGEDVNGNPFSY